MQRVTRQKPKSVTDPESNSDDQNTRDEKTEWRSVSDINSTGVYGLGQSSERYEEQQQRRDYRLADALCKHSLVEEQIALPGRIQFRIM